MSVKAAWVTKKGIKRGKRRAGIFTRVVWHADDPKSIETWDFGINGFQGGFEISLERSENYIHVQFTLLSLVPGQVGRHTCSHSLKLNLHNRFAYFNSRNVTELQNILKKLPWNMQQENNLR